MPEIQNIALAEGKFTNQSACIAGKWQWANVLAAMDGRTGGPKAASHYTFNLIYYQKRY